jgi:hypothetical protein
MTRTLKYSDEKSLTQNEFVSDGLARQVLTGKSFHYESCNITKFIYEGATKEELQDIFMKGRYQLQQCNFKTCVYEESQSPHSDSFFSSEIQPLNSHSLEVTISLKIAENNGVVKDYTIIISGMGNKDLIPYDCPYQFLE